MIAFKDIEISDKEAITKYTMTSDRRNCDLSFSNLCSWRFLYNTQYAIVNNFLVLRFWRDGELAYMMPVGNGNLKETIKLLILDARAQGQPFRMLGVCKGMQADLENILPDKFVYTTTRDLADYIYLRTDLATLKGKKFQSKRNFTNRFRRANPNYEYAPITPQNIDECLILEEKWCKTNDCDEFEDTDNERKALTFALKNFEAIGLTGGLLRLDGEIIAFTYGMPINHDTFGVHVEKADTEIEGAYAMINMEFANRIPEEYTYINREEDLGVPGLRKAKLSYNPAILLEKSMVNLLQDEPVELINW
ncbi:DUF2156 domain-containing protein [Bacteroides propionicifaciens]|uniref:DUF2156 domain-containing protein n=1 Tax=Bacteroides propionicifaciens TaxID=392838 RepID=UPI000374E0BA|nr:phosphatidylglycerol lysyltransferase domain-containing protein [Bacteroides propionicifaciens]